MTKKRQTLTLAVEFLILDPFLHHCTTSFPSWSNFVVVSLFHITALGDPLQTHQIVDCDNGARHSIRRDVVAGYLDERLAANPFLLTMRHCVAESVSSLAMIVLAANVLGDWILVGTAPTAGWSVLHCCRCLRPISSSLASSDTLTADVRQDVERTVNHADSFPMALVVGCHLGWAVSNGGTGD